MARADRTPTPEWTSDYVAGMTDVYGGEAEIKAWVEAGITEYEEGQFKKAAKSLRRAAEASYERADNLAKLAEVLEKA